MTKRLVVLSVITLFWTIIAGRPEASHSGKAYAVSTAFAVQQPAPSTSKVTWEYRILLGNRLQLASLESSINQLAEQGYNVETFQPVSSVSGGRAQNTYSPFVLNSNTEIFVLLKRIRR